LGKCDFLSWNDENEVPIIDLFVDGLSVKDYGFRTDYIENGHLLITLPIC
jgi:hypothetical protein